MSEIISNKSTTTIQLVENHPTIHGGAFREGENCQDQVLDVGDAYARKDWPRATGAGSIIHELVEAFNDQVLNGCPTAKNPTERNQAYLKAHKPALTSQAKVDGFDFQINTGIINRLENTNIIQAFNRVSTATTDGKCEDRWFLTEYANNGPNNSPTLIRSIEIKDVTLKTENTGSVRVQSYKPKE